jgi:hypothetical protein
MSDDGGASGTMTDDRMRVPPPDMGEGIDDEGEPLPDITLGIWGDDAGLDGAGDAAEVRPDPVARFKDRLRRAASERGGRQRDDA